MSAAPVDLSAHGVGVRLECDDPFVVDAFAHDFAYFLAGKAEPACPITMTIRVRPANERPAGWKSFFAGSRSVFFRSPGTERRVCFFDRAWIRYDYDGGQAEIFSDDSEAAYEVLYIAVLSYLGESLDQKGIHRIHGLGLAFGEDGMILMAASGTGKSTLGMAILLGDGPSIVSDDTPALAWPATMLAFPLRVAVEKEPPVPQEFVRKFRRVGLKEKYVISADYFMPRIRRSVPLRWLVELRRDHSPRPRFVRASKLRALRLVFLWLVYGYETNQAWEFFVRFSIGDVFAKALIVLRRLKVAAGVLMRSEFIQFHLSDDPKACGEALRAFKGAEE